MTEKKIIFMDSFEPGSGSEPDEKEYENYSDHDDYNDNDNVDVDVEDIKQLRQFTQSPAIQNMQPMQEKIKNKDRSVSMGSECSESSECSKKPNFKCGSCKKIFQMDKNQNMIRCAHCGYRILYKLRTKNHISYKTE